MSYFRWSIGSDVSLFLELVKLDGNGQTGASPTVMIRRYKNVDGGFLDNYYWSGSGFTSSPFSHSMSEIDSTNQPGIYSYYFSQSLVQSGTLYNVYYRNNSSPLGFTFEEHYFVMSSSTGDIKVYESEAD